jgi:hypothetical protein
MATNEEELEVQVGVMTRVLSQVQKSIRRYSLVFWSATLGMAMIVMPSQFAPVVAVGILLAAVEYER